VSRHQGILGLQAGEDVKDMKEIQRRMLELAEQAEAEETDPITETKALQLSLPGFDGTWYMPNEYARAALFGIVRRGRRRYMREEPIASWPGGEIRYTGEQLDQADLDVLMAAASMVNQSMDGKVRTTRRALLKAAGRKGAGSKDIKWLRSTLSRMTACDVTLENERYVYHGNILNSAEDKETGELVIHLNPQQRWLWNERNTTRLNHDQRTALSTDLAKWLQGYVSSHRATPRHPHQISLEKLQPLTGSTAPMRNFRVAVKKAMAELEQAGIVTAWAVGKNLVFVR